VLIIQDITGFGNNDSKQCMQNSRHRNVWEPSAFKDAAVPPTLLNVGSQLRLKRGITKPMTNIYSQQQNLLSCLREKTYTKTDSLLQHCGMSAASLNCAASRDRRC
jgi:hypothetical protein